MASCSVVIECSTAALAIAACTSSAAFGVISAAAAAAAGHAASAGKPAVLAIAGWAVCCSAAGACATVAGSFGGTAAGKAAADGSCGGSCESTPVVGFCVGAGSSTARVCPSGGAGAPDCPDSVSDPAVACVMSSKVSGRLSMF